MLLACTICTATSMNGVPTGPQDLKTRRQMTRRGLRIHRELECVPSAAAVFCNRHGKSDPLDENFGLPRHSFLIAVFESLQRFRNRGRVKSTARKHWKYAAIIGPGAIMTYLLVLYALTFGQVSYIASLRETSTVFGAVAGFVFLKEKCTTTKVVAIALIVAGAVMIKLV